jgi:hypothetical protein
MKELYNKNRKPILIVAAIAVIAFFIYRSANSNPKSNLTPAVLSFESSSETITSDSSIKIKADTKENKVGFVQVKVTFDPSKVSLKEEPSANPSFKTVVKNTTVDEANGSGEIILAIGLEPGNTGQSGSFDVGTLNFEPKNADESITLSFDTTNSQIVTMDAKAVPLEKKDLTIMTK